MHVLRDRKLSRRTMLTGALGGAVYSVGLPFLDVMQPRRASAQTAPKRFVGFFKPNGMAGYRSDPFGNQASDRWTPQQTGPNWTMTPILQGFGDRGLKGDITIVSCMHNPIIGLGLAHDAQTTLLTPFKYIRVGTKQYETSGGGKSLDQVVGETVGAGTKFKSLEFGCALASNTVAPMSCFWSYRGPQQPNPSEPNPLRMWTKVFSQGVSGGATDPAAVERLRKRRLSILDAIRQNTAVVQKKLGAADRARLDDHLASIRAIEQSITNIQAAAGCNAPSAPADLPDRDSNMPMVLPAQIDLLVMALTCDLTRAATLMLGGGQSDANYNFLGYNSNHHEGTHGGPGYVSSSYGSALEQVTKVDRWQNDHIAILIDKLKKTPEAGKTLLDSTVVMAGSDVTAGWGHNEGGGTWQGKHQPQKTFHDWAFILAGGTHYFKHGSHVRYKWGTTMHTQVLQSIKEAVTGDPSTSWMEAQYAIGPAPGLRGDTHANLL